MNQEDIEILDELRSYFEDRALLKNDAESARIHNALLNAIEIVKGLKKSPWISTREMLPKRWQMVLVTYRTTDNRIIPEYEVTLCRYYEQSEFWEKSVVAWCPVPEQYKAKSEDAEMEVDHG